MSIQSAEQRAGSIPSLDGFRAVAILLVFLAHVPIAYSVPGGFGVTLFFFLSGFLITTLLFREYDNTGNIALGAFFWRRALRLLPPIAATLAMALAFFAAGIAPGDGDLGAVTAQLLFYFNYYLVEAYGGTTVDGLGVFWSLSVEGHFYLLWPFVFLSLARGRIRVSHVAVLIGLVLLWRTLRVWIFGADEWQIMLSTDTRIDSLLWGCFLAVLMRPGGWLDRPAPGFWLIHSLLAGAAVLLLVADFGISNQRLRSSIQYTLEGLALVPVFFLAVRRPDFWCFRPLNWAPVRTLGQWSYAIYLGHYVLIETLAANGLLVGGIGLFLVVAVLLTLLWGWLIHRIVERPLAPLRVQLRPPARLSSTS